MAVSFFLLGLRARWLPKSRAISRKVAQFFKILTAKLRKFRRRTCVHDASHAPRHNQKAQRVVQHLCGTCEQLLNALRACRAQNLRQNVAETRAISAELRVNSAAKRAPETSLTFANALQRVKEKTPGAYPAKQ